MEATTVQRGATTGLAIQDAAAKIGVSAHTLRYYERAGLVPPVTRDAGGRRRFTSIDLGWAVFVRKLRRAGLSIGAIRTYAQLQMQGIDTIEQRVEILRGHRNAVRSRLQELEETLAYLEGKVAHYERVLAGEIEDSL